MKTKSKIYTLAAIISLGFAACKGGVTAEKQDSTMLNRHAMDSTAKQNQKAGTQSNPKDSVPKDDTSAGTSTLKH
jgi:hypothetical protein